MRKAGIYAIGVLDIELFLEYSYTVKLKCMTQREIMLTEYRSIGLYFPLKRASVEQSNVSGPQTRGAIRRVHNEETRSVTTFMCQQMPQHLPKFVNKTLVKLPVLKNLPKKVRKVHVQGLWIQI